MGIRIEPDDGTPADVVLLVLAAALKYECTNPDGHLLHEPHGPLVNHWCFHCKYCTSVDADVLHIHVAKDTREVT